MAKDILTVVDKAAGGTTDQNSGVAVCRCNGPSMEEEHGSSRSGTASRWDQVMEYVCGVRMLFGDLKPQLYSEKAGFSGGSNYGSRLGLGTGLCG
jgi:hypothetical protein